MGKVKKHQRLGNFWNNFRLILILVIPSILFYFILLFLAFKLFNEKEVSLIVYQSIIVITLTFSAITFSYAKAIKGDKRKFKPLIYCGERFIHASIFSLFILVFVYTSKVYLAPYESLFYNIIKFFLNSVATAFMFFAVRDFDYAIKKLWKIALKDYNYDDPDRISDNWKFD